MATKSKKTQIITVHALARMVIEKEAEAWYISPIGLGDACISVAL